VAEGHEARSERGGDWRLGVPLPRDGGPGCHPGKILKFETQFGAVWCILARYSFDGSPVFHLCDCERKHCHRLMLDSGIDTVAYYLNFLVVWMPSSCFVVRAVALHWTSQLVVKTGTPP